MKRFTHWIILCAALLPVVLSGCLPGSDISGSGTPLANPSVAITALPIDTLVPPTAAATAATVVPVPTLMATAAVTISVPAAVQAGESIFEDPSGRFSMAVPTSWKVQDRQDYLALTDPDGGIKIYTLLVSGTDAAQGAQTAWTMVDPTFDLKVKDVTRPPSGLGVDETASVTFESGDQQRFVNGYAQRVKDRIYVLLLDAKADDAARRAAELQIILTGFAIKGLAKTDLTNVPAKPLTPEKLAELEAYITDAMKRADVPGAEVAVVQDDQVAYIKGFGVRELGKADPVTPDTLMMIGSVGKTMTTMMMATLVDDKHMTWDTPAVQILPSFAVADPELTTKITMRNLVCACTGVPRHDLQLMFANKDLTAQDVVASLRDFQFFTKFGEAFQYSNQMVATGGYLAAVAAGAQPDDMYNGYLAQMQQRVFDPIGMPNTTFSFDKVQADPDHATPHTYNLFYQYIPLPLSVEQGVLSPVTPAGVSWSNARDMARYLITELNQGINPDGKRVVSAENLKVTWQPQVSISADMSYGLGWFVDKYKGLQLLHHGGNTFGFTTDLAFLPTAHLGIVVITNGLVSNAFNEAVRTRLFELAFDLPKEGDAQLQYFLDSKEKRGQDAKAQVKEVDPAAVAPYLGEYHNDAVGDFAVAMQDGRLMLIATKFSSELRPKVDSAGKTTYVPFSGPAASFPFEFQKDAAGRPVIVLAVPPDNYTFTQLHAAEPAMTVVPPTTVSPPETPVVGGATDTTPVVTLADDGTTIKLHPGQRFLLKLGEDFDWTVIVADQEVASRVINVTTVRGAQGLYEAHKAGQTTLTATGDPACRSAQPPCGAPSRRFQASIVVASE